MVANAVPLRTMATRDNTDIEVSRQPRDGIDRPIREIDGNTSTLSLRRLGNPQNRGCPPRTRGRSGPAGPSTS